ncbi:MAG: A24 family peptidase [Steroidobacteraceae bacterium]
MTDIAALYVESRMLFSASVGLIGLLVGSFLNVVIYRLPIILERDWRAQAAEMLPAGLREPAAVAEPASRLTLSTPRSACPACRAPISALQNIPVVSWLMLRGKCAACRAPISIRYPLVELGTALSSAWVAWHFGFGASAAYALAVTWTLIALAGIDIDHQLLPDDLTLPLLWAGLLAAVLAGAHDAQALPVSPRDAIIGAAAGYLSLWLVFQGFRLVTGKEGMGYGDFKLLAALGAWLGWHLLPVIILISAAAGALVGIGMIVLRGRARTAPMSFGPYLAAAGWLAMLYGDALVSTYLRAAGVRP